MPLLKKTAARKLFLFFFLSATISVNAQNVGIGTLTPQAKLHIISPGDEVLRLDAANPYLSLYSGGVYKGYFWKSPNSIELGSATGSNLPITFAPNGNQLMYIGANGNVGMGTLSPLVKLHVFQGTSGNTTPLGPLVVEGSGNTYINLLSPDLNETSVLFGKASSAISGGIVYNNSQLLNGFQFRTNGNSTKMVLDQNGNVGIGTISPYAKLHVSAGDASFALFGPNSYNGMLYVGASSNNQSAVFTAQVMASDGNLHIDPAAGKNIYLGYYQARDIFMNPGGGKVGIGNSNPGYQLDISNRMRIRSGGNSGVSAGLWLNNNANTETAFIGMEDDTHVGILGVGAGWKFGMNTQTGALKINGSEGQAGQVLTSGGGAAAPGWGSVSSWIFNNIQQNTQTGSAVAVCCVGVDLPGMGPYSVVMTISATSKLIISNTAQMESLYCLGCGTSYGTVGTYIHKDGGTAVFAQVDGKGNAGNASITTLSSGVNVITLTPGTYDFNTYGTNFGGPSIRFTNGKVFIMVISQ
jgi:hypothetical protein